MSDELRIEMPIDNQMRENDHRAEFLEAMNATWALGNIPIAQPSSPNRRTDLMRAVTAACAMLAHADGKIVPAERRKFQWVTRAHSELARFSREELSNEFQVYELAFALDLECAYDLVAANIKRLAPRCGDALFLVDACRAMILADGIAEAAEFEALQTIKAILGVDMSAIRGSAEAMASLTE
jgi:tellurite resistance protein TerB